MNHQIGEKVVSSKHFQITFHIRPLSNFVKIAQILVAVMYVQKY